MSKPNNPDVVEHDRIVAEINRGLKKVTDAAKGRPKSIREVGIKAYFSHPEIRALNTQRIKALARIDAGRPRSSSLMSLGGAADFAESALVSLMDSVPGGLGQKLGAGSRALLKGGSYADNLTYTTEKVNASKNKSLAGNLTGNVAGVLVPGGGMSRAANGVSVLSRLGTKVTPATMKLFTKAKHVSAVKSATQAIAKAVTPVKGQRAANAARYVGSGAAVGAADAFSRGDNVKSGAIFGGGGGALAPVLVKTAKFANRKIRDFTGRTTGDEALAQLVEDNAGDVTQAIRDFAKAAKTKPTLFETLSPQTRKNIQAVIQGSAKVADTASRAIRKRAATVGPDMAKVVKESAGSRTLKIAGRIKESTKGVNQKTLPKDLQDAEGLARIRKNEAETYAIEMGNPALADSFDKMFPKSDVFDEIGSTAVSPESLAILREAAGKSRYKVENFDLSDVRTIDQNLSDMLKSGRIDPNLVRAARNEMEGVLAAKSPKSAKYLAEKRDAYYRASQRLDGFGYATKPQVRGVDQAKPLSDMERTNLDSPEGRQGQFLGRVNQLNSDFLNDPTTVGRVVAGISDTPKMQMALSDSLGGDVSGKIVAAARAQNEGLRNLSQLRTGNAGEATEKTGQDLVGNLAVLTPSMMASTRSRLMAGLVNRFGMPENAANTAVELLFSQNPQKIQYVIDVLAKQQKLDTPGVNQILASMASGVGVNRVLNYEEESPEVVAQRNAFTDIPEIPTGEETPVIEYDENGDIIEMPETSLNAPEPLSGPETSLNAPEPLSDPETSLNAPEPLSGPETSLETENSPYRTQVEEYKARQDPGLVDLFRRQFKQESGNRQFDRNGNPIRSSAGAVGIAQVMRGTAPEAAKLAGVPFDERRWLTDSHYNELIGMAYMANNLRRYDGDAAKALAAYNGGAGNVDTAIRKAKQAGRPEEWMGFLAKPEETIPYVQNILGR